MTLRLHAHLVLAPAAAVAILALAVAGCPSTPEGDEGRRVPTTPLMSATPTRAGTGLTAFASKETLDAYVAELRAEYAKRIRDRRARPMSSAAAEAAPAPMADGDDKSGEEGITNNQENGVDEGGIVKVHGDHLVVLRRGRLFTVDIGGSELSSLSMANVFPAGSKPNAWYDEMLIHGDTAVIIGYSYGKQATEVGLFDLDAQGGISHRDTYYLRSNDYYSSRNYASRLLGSKLVFYMPYQLLQHRWDGDEHDVVASFPALQRHGDGGNDWNDIIAATKIYRPLQSSDWPVLHTVITCDLARPAFRCDAQGVLGPYSRSFYVSSNAVYVWAGGVSGQDPREPSKSTVYRLPLRDAKPGALEMWGSPTDQFSFKERAGNLHMLVRAQKGGDAMWSAEWNADWNAEVTTGDVALMTAPISAFAELDHNRVTYTRLPRPGRSYPFHNRFVGDHVLYGSGKSWGRKETGDRQLFIHPYQQPGKTVTLQLSHDVERIEALGRDAVVVGSRKNDLHFTSVALSKRPHVASRYVQAGAAQGETRSHGFFFKPQPASHDTGAQGTLGLPIRSGGEPGAAHLRHGSAQVLYLRVDDLALRPVGALASRSSNTNDRCVASCVDWYGNARPIFLRGRVFALLGYELVEGRLEDAAITEVARVNFLAAAR